MSNELTPLVDNVTELLATEPWWGWYLVRAWRAGRLGAIVPPPVLEPFIALASFEVRPPDAAALSAALDEAAKASRAPDARGFLLWKAGFLLPPPWTVVLDELARADKGAVPDSPRFLDLARFFPDRAAEQVEHAFAVDRSNSSIPPNLLYEALIACEEAGKPVPDALIARRESFEAMEGGLVDESARFIGRLRLAARHPGSDAMALAKEAIDWLGADDVYVGLWSVLGRVPGAIARAPEWIDFRPRTPTPEVVVSLLANLGAASAADVDARATTLVAAVKAETVWRQQAWPAAWRLLGAAASLGAQPAVDSLLSLGLPHWAVEYATYQELRKAPALTSHIAEYQAKPHPVDPPLDPPAPPPWAYLDPAVFRARLLFLTDPTLGIPTGPSWGDGIP